MFTSYKQSIDLALYSNVDIEIITNNVPAFDYFVQQSYLRVIKYYLLLYQLDVYFFENISKKHLK